MSVRDTLLKHLAQSRNAAVEGAVEAALSQALPHEQKELAEVLLQRNRRPGWIALVRSFHKLPHQLQDHLLALPRDLFGPLSDTMDDDEGSGRMNVIEIVRKAGDPKLTFLLTEALSDLRPEIRTNAANAVLELIRQYYRKRIAWLRHPEEPPQSLPVSEANPAEEPASPAPLTSSITDPALLGPAVDFALRQFKTHHSEQIVLAALLFERQQDTPLWDIFSDQYAEATRVAVQLLRQFDDPDLATAALLALGSHLKPAALAGLGSCGGPTLAIAVAQESYRLLDPVLANAYKGIPHPHMFIAPPEHPPWDDTNWLDYLRLLEYTGMTPQEKIPWLALLGAHVPVGPMHRAAKLMVMRALSALHIPEALQAIAAFSADVDETIARCATRYIIGRRHADWRSHSQVLLKSPHESVRRLVSQTVTPGQFERLWQQYLKLPPAVQVLSTRTLSENDARFADLLRSKLSSPSTAEVAQGLKMVITLQDLKPFREHIIALCSHADARVVATAVRLIARLEDPTLKDILEAAANHSDSRVRANAIEAMETLQVADRSQQVLAMLHSRFHRERANAIRAISRYDFATAKDCLLKMLTDASAQHRVSALWVVGQLNLQEIYRQVSSLATRDQNQHVRKRAEELLAQLQQVTTAFAGPKDHTKPPKGSK